MKRIIIVIIALTLCGCEGLKRLVNGSPVSKNEPPIVYDPPMPFNLPVGYVVTKQSNGFERIHVVRMPGLKDNSFVEVWVTSNPIGKPWPGWTRIETCDDIPQADGCYYFEYLDSLGYYLRFANTVQYDSYFIWKIQPN